MFAAVVMVPVVRPALWEGRFSGRTAAGRHEYLQKLVSENQEKGEPPGVRVKES